VPGVATVVSILVGVVNTSTERSVD